MRQLVDLPGGHGRQAHQPVANVVWSVATPSSRGLTTRRHSALISPNAICRFLTGLVVESRLIALGMRRLLIVIAVGWAAANMALAEERSAPPGMFCWPIHFAGIVPGITSDAQVQRLLGPGVLKSDGAGDGTRCYIDPKGTATLRVSWCTDHTVCEVSLELGVRPDLSPPERRRAVSRHFLPLEGFGNGHALNLGASKEAVAQNLGAPADTDGKDTWTYNAYRTCEIPEYLIFHFVAGKVVRVVFSAPAG